VYLRKKLLSKIATVLPDKKNLVISDEFNFYLFTVFTPPPLSSKALTLHLEIRRAALVSSPSTSACYNNI